MAAHACSSGMPGRRWLLTAIMAAMMAGCSTTKIVQQWRDPDLQSPGYQRVVILAMTPNEVDRRAYETAFAQRLAREKHVQGIAGYTLLPDYPDYRNERKIIAAVRKAGADMVVIASLISVKKSERYVPPRLDYSPAFGMGFGYHHYSYMSFGMVYRPGYVKKEVRVRLEAVAFDARKNKMIWAGTTESFNPESSQTLIAEHVDLVVAAMRKNGLIQ